MALTCKFLLLPVIPQNLCSRLVIHLLVIQLAIHPVQVRPSLFLFKLGTFLQALPKKQLVPGTTAFPSDFRNDETSFLMKKISNVPGFLRIFLMTPCVPGFLRSFQVTPLHLVFYAWETPCDPDIPTASVARPPLFLVSFSKHLQVPWNVFPVLQTVPVTLVYSYLQPASLHLLLPLTIPLSSCLCFLVYGYQLSTFLHLSDPLWIPDYYLWAVCL